MFTLSFICINQIFGRFIFLFFQFSDNDSIEQMEFMQENGEYFVSNEINFASTIENDENLMSTDNINEEEEEEDDDILIQEEEPIELPPQRRCFSHLLNLISADFEKLLSGSVKNNFINAFSKMHSLWALVNRSTLAKR